jgi:hypothetical protein
MHYSVEDLYDIFHNTNTSKQYHYAILTLFKEVDFNDVLNYCELFNIDKNNLKTMYEFYKEKFNKEDIKEYEWLFKEL